jgi:hypothetical protein
MYVVQRDDGAFVSADPHRTGGSSYTRDLQKAKTFVSIADARLDLCPGNERVVSVVSLLAPPARRAGRYGGY